MPNKIKKMEFMNLKETNI